MNFLKIAQARQSCRAYDETKEVESEKLEAILEAARIAPSACNGQPYKITVCRGKASEEVALACRGLGMNKFATQAPITLVISEMPYVKSAAMGAKVKGNDYRSIDIGIVTAYLTAEATAQGLSTCILGWLDDSKIREVCDLEHPVRLVITLGYAKEGDPLRKKVRKEMDALVSYKEQAMNRSVLTASGNLKCHCVRLRRGDDLMKSIRELCREKNIAAGVVLSAVGCISKGRLRDASGVTIREITDHCEIVSLDGTVSAQRCHLHISLSREDLSTIGGHLCPGCIINTTCELVIAELPGIRFGVEEDLETGYEELIFQSV